MKKLFFGFIVSLIGFTNFSIVLAQGTFPTGPYTLIKSEKDFYQWARSLINDAADFFDNRSPVIDFTGPNYTVNVTPYTYTSDQGNDPTTVQSVVTLRDEYNQAPGNVDSIEEVQAKLTPLNGYLDTIQRNTKKTRDDFAQKKASKDSQTDPQWKFLSDYHYQELIDYADKEMASSISDIRVRLSYVLAYIEQDDDKDGVVNNEDKCPSTPVDPSGEFPFVDKNGCDCEKKNCEQFEGFICQKALVKELDPNSKTIVPVRRAICIEVPDYTPYDLREAMRDAQNINHGDDRFIAVYPQHLVGADEKSLQGDASDITVFFQRLANGLTILAGSLAVIFMVINGFTMVVSAGADDQISTAKKGLLWSTVGLLLIIMAYIIVKTAISISYSGQELEPGIERRIGEITAQ